MSFFTDYVKNMPKIAPEKMARIQARERVGSMVRFMHDGGRSAIQWHYVVNGDGVNCCVIVSSKWVDVSDLARPIPMRPALERLIQVLPPKIQSVRDDLKLGYGL